MNFESYSNRFPGSDLFTKTLWTIYDFCSTVCDEIDIPLDHFCNLSADSAIMAYKDIGYCIDRRDGMLHAVGDVIGIPWLDMSKDFDIGKMPDANLNFLNRYILHDKTSPRGRILTIPDLVNKEHSVPIQDAWDELDHHLFLEELLDGCISDVPDWLQLIDIVIDLAIRCTTIASIPYRIYLDHLYRDNPYIRSNEMRQDLVATSTIFVNTVFRKMVDPIRPGFISVETGRRVQFKVKADIITAYHPDALVEDFMIFYSNTRLVERD